MNLRFLKEVMPEQPSTENRGKQIAVGAAIMFVVFAAVTSLLLFWRFIPGWVGESVGMVAGVITTPFFMEASFILLGFAIVIGLNTWLRNRAGDEFVTFEADEFTSGRKPRAGERD